MSLHRPPKQHFKRVRRAWHKSAPAARIRDNTAKRLPHLHGERLLKECARVARLGFALSVWQWKPGFVSGGHSRGSLHYQTYPDGVGKAFDAYGAQQTAYAQYLDQHAPQLTELINNPGASRKNGSHVSPSFWGSTTWRNHTSHTHVANDGPPS